MFILTIIPVPLGLGSPVVGQPENNPTQRLAEIRGKISAAEIRIRDLEALLTELILNPLNDVSVVDPASQPGGSGTELFGLVFTVEDKSKTGGTRSIANGRFTIPDQRRVTSDANLVRQELYAARAYEGELRTAEQFWNQIVQANKEAEKDTHELFKRA